MLTNLGLVTALTLALGQAGQLSLTDVRLTHGVLGPVRADAKVLPGDSLIVAFDLDGVATDSDGKVQYSTALEVTDARGKSVFKTPAREQSVLNALGGNRVPAFARVDIGLEQPAGEYTLKVTATDRTRNASQTLTQPFTVLPKGFGLVGLTLTADADATVPAGVVGAGDTVFVNAAAVGFGRSGGEAGQPNLSFKLRVLDEAGQPTVAKPFAGVINKDVAGKVPSVPLQFVLSLNRAGRYTVELQATDHVADKTVTRSFPITVHPHASK
jgi:hypothetical protein